MKYILLSLLFIPLIIFVNNLVQKNKLLLNYCGEKHQKFTSNNNIPLTGGIYIFIFSLFFYHNFNPIFSYYLFSFLILGLLSDKKIITSPKVRFFIQLFLVILFVVKFNLSIIDIRIDYFNFLLENYLFQIFFVVLCFMILINGTNFIDGCNTLVIGYYIIIAFTIFYLKLFLHLNFGDDLIFGFTIFLTILFFFNFFNKFYLGDSGSYLISVIFGSLLVLIYQNNKFISPYFIVLLLWYPAFETLFSIIRKLIIKKSFLEPDTKHLHQLIFLYFKKKFKKNTFNNSLTAISINFYNLVIFLVASKDIYDSKFQILLIIFNILFYLIMYLNFYNFKKRL